MQQDFDGLGIIAEEKVESENNSNSTIIDEKYSMLYQQLESACDATRPFLSQTLFDLENSVVTFLSSESIPYKAKIVMQYMLRNWLDKVGSIEKALSHLHEMAQKQYVPEALENEGIEKLTLAGVGTVYLQDDCYVSINSERKEEAYQWLDDEGNGDLIKPSINASSLSALIKKKLKNGDEVPADLIKMTPYTKAVIKTK